LKKQALNSAVKYFGNFFNLDLEDSFTMLDVEEELEKIENLANFRFFVKDKIAYEKYRFLSPYQKFITMANDFKKEYKLKLDENTQDKIYSYTFNLLSKLTSYCNELNWSLETQSIDIRNVNLESTFKKAFDNKAMEIIQSIGVYNTYRYALKNIPYLEELIEKTITQKALLKKYPQLANKSKAQDGLETIKKLQNMSRQKLGA